MHGTTAEAGPIVDHFRQILLWPLELMPVRADEQIQKHWDLLERATSATPWREVEDEFTPDAELFQERHYSEFVTCLPYVQRFLYGETRERGGASESPIRVFRRADVARARLTFPGQDDPIVLDVVHVDLYFFYDIDVVILVVELSGAGLTLLRVQETLYRLGRAYPTHWENNGQGGHCLTRMEWLSPGGAVLAVSDYEKREKFLSHVCRYRAPAIASHWEFLLTPMTLHQSDQRGVLRYRPIEYHRMPLLGYLGMADGARLGRAEFVRLGLVTAPGAADVLPFSEHHVKDFEARYCYDRHWDDRTGGTRYLCSGEALMMVGSAADPYVVDRETGLLAHFRHQHFLLFLIAHFHRASLVMLSDRLVDALSRLDIKDAESVKQFKRSIRHLKEIFLRFTHRYWFHEISDQAQVRALYRMAHAALDTDRLFAEVRDEIQDMSAYLDSDSLRRQANTVIRLTVVTTVGLIGTIATGFLGMNLIAAADASVFVKLAYFILVLVPTTGITAFSILRSKRLADFLEALADERLPGRRKLGALADVWRRPRRRRPEQGAHWS